MKKKKREDARRRGLAPRETLLPQPAHKEIDLGELEAILERAASTLPSSDVETLRATVETLVAFTRELEKKGTSVLRLRHLLFGPRTESRNRLFPDPPDGGKEAAPDDTASAKEGDGANQGGDDADSANPADKPKRKGHGRNGASKLTGASRISLNHEALKHNDRCPGCRAGNVYRQSEPAQLVRIRGLAPLSATVYEKERLRCGACGEVFTAASPEGVGDEKYDETVPPMIGMFHYGAGMPFYRLERTQARLGIPLPASTQWDLVQGAANWFAPVVLELIRLAAQASLIHDDDTTMRILKLDRALLAQTHDIKGLADRTGVFTSGLIAVGEGYRIALFFTGVLHAGENVEQVLKNRAKSLPPPTQMCDALSWNVKGETPTLVANCLAHGRRRFVELADYFPDESRFVIDALADVYEHDAQAREREMSPDERLLHHQTLSGPRMGELRTWLDKQISERLVEPNSAFGGAVEYMRKHWSELTLFLRVPGAPLDNNICERALKRAVLHRKNSLFYKTLNGARVGDTFMSLIHTCELNDVNPFTYMVDLLRNQDELVFNAAKWLPWNYKERLAELGADRAPGG